MDSNSTDFDFANLHINFIIAWVDNLREMLYQQQGERVQRLHEIIWDIFYDFPFDDENENDFGNCGCNTNFYPWH
ncbi:uncharacterized protein TrAtP1_002387 [Trichoderma atroviride]|uniref:uncharacterized protein n=1 Tax=Hypocrea atroviridis TaxID=63577 RepID=UPI00332C0B06|nr:hypothetical protein TrAtP1_002387 [Trichoderma atroviride]